VPRWLLDVPAFAIAGGMAAYLGIATEKLAAETLIGTWDRGVPLATPSFLLGRGACVPGVGPWPGSRRAWPLSGHPFPVPAVRPVAVTMRRRYMAVFLPVFLPAGRGMSTRSLLSEDRRTRDGPSGFNVFRLRAPNARRLSPSRPASWSSPRSRAGEQARSSRDSPVVVRHVSRKGLGAMLQLDGEPHPELFQIHVAR
jgi:hypothetical protein